MTEQTMYVLHVSRYNIHNQQPTRLVIGCEDVAENMTDFFQELGYDVLMTWETFPERDLEEAGRARKLLSMYYTRY